MNKVHVENLHKKFGDLHVLKGINLDVEESEVVCLIGPSGSGKSTLLRCLNLLETPTNGTVIVDGNELTNSKIDINKVRENIGMVFQQFNLFPHLTVLENIMLAPVDRGKLTKEQAEKKALELLASVGLSEKRDEYPKNLSGGQQQRVAIARALVMKPDILCFDEPTSALDPELTGEVLKVIRNLAENNTTMIIVTHEMAFARDVADQVIFMDDGYVVEAGDPKEVINNPKEERTRQFLSRYTEG